MAKSIVPVKIEKLELLVDSRSLASALGVEHSSWRYEVLKKYKKFAEENFGILQYKTGKRKGKKGRPEEYYMLTEDQAYFFLTLSKNSKRVVTVKAELVKSFSKCRKQLQIIQLELFKIQSDPEWQEERQDIKESNKELTDAIKAYIERNEEKVSANGRKWIYKHVNDKLSIAIVGSNVAKFQRKEHVESFRDALPKDQLKQLEQLETLVIKLINNNIHPYEAISEAKTRLLI